MQLLVHPTQRLAGEVIVPASKSHTIRAILIASLATGTSRLMNPLYSADTRAAINAFRSLGARIEERASTLVIDGFGSGPQQPAAALNMLNSGTSTNLLLGTLAALGIQAEITGDASLRSRPVAALAEALQALGCTISYLEKEGCPPVRISGALSGGTVRLDASKSSQYVSSLLLCCPLLPRDTEIVVENATELPYIDMTLQWLDTQRIRYERDGYRVFRIRGKQTYRPFTRTIPADWSSATFPLCAAAVTDSDVLIRGVDVHDVQGDKAVAAYLKAMGADLQAERNGIRVRGCRLTGRALDINATPDALPALAVVGCHAHGTTKLYNVAQARVKETDRIQVMAHELKKMNGTISEMADGLLISKSELHGTPVNGHHDHRVVMALSLAGLIAEGSTTVTDAEAISVTYPTYVESMQQLGARISFQ